MPYGCIASDGGHRQPDAMGQKQTSDCRLPDVHLEVKETIAFQIHNVGFGHSTLTFTRYQRYIEPKRPHRIWMSCARTMMLFCRKDFSSDFR